MNQDFTCYRCKGHFLGDRAFDEHVRYGGCYSAAPPSQPLVEVQEPVGVLLARAADFLEWYAAFIVESVMSVDIERHPYLPELEDIAEQVRALSVSTAIAAAPVRGLPLTPAQIKRAIDNDPEALRRPLTAFCHGVRFAEKYHGIGASSPSGSGEEGK